jgi:hypothetical protein
MVAQLVAGGGFETGLCESTLASDAPAAWSGPEGAWTLVPGGRVVDESAPLYRVGTASFLPDGALAVTNVGSGEILVFDRAGNLSASMGGVGPGPAEFGSLLSAAPLGGSDTIVALDGRAQAAKLFRASGELIRTVPLERSPLHPVEMLLPFGTGFVGLGRWTWSSQGRELVAGAKSASVPITLFDEQGGAVRVLASIPGRDHLILFTANGGFSTMSRPLGPSPWITIVGDCVAHPVAGRAAVALRSATGALIRELAVPGVDLTISSREWDEIVTRAKRSGEGHGGTWDEPWPPPEAKPAWRRGAYDGGRYLWLQRYDAPGVAARGWDVLDIATGGSRWVEAPPGVVALLAARGESLALLKTAELGLEIIDFWTVAPR